MKKPAQETSSSEPTIGKKRVALKESDPVSLSLLHNNCISML